jgi:hypothetical protein
VDGRAPDPRAAGVTAPQPDEASDLRPTVTLPRVDDAGQPEPDTTAVLKVGPTADRSRRPDNQSQPRG